MITKKDKIIFTTIFTIFIIIFVVFFTIKHINQNKFINQSKEYLNEKYGLKKENLKLNFVKLEQNIYMCSGECFSRTKEKFPAYIRFKYENKIITVSNNHDDYLYDGLYNGLRNYYAKLLDINYEDIYIEINRYLYIEYIYQKDIKIIDDNIISDFNNYILDYILNNDYYDNCDNFNNCKKIVINVRIDENNNEDYDNKISNFKNQLDNHYSDKFIIYTYTSPIKLECKNDTPSSWEETDPKEYIIFRYCDIKIN